MIDGEHEHIIHISAQPSTSMAPHNTKTMMCHSETIQTAASLPKSFDKTTRMEVMRKPKKRRRRRSTSDEHQNCHVCGDNAPSHIHYGGIACFSCRAFFRRSVSKYSSYVCSASKTCIINPITRKNCQHCRYQKCLGAGMKEAWVLTDNEKLERKAKMNGNSNQDKVNYHRTSENIIKFGSEAYFTLGEADELKIYSEANSKSKIIIPMSEKTRADMIQMMRSGQPMSTQGIIEFFKLIYSRMVSLAQSVKEFQTLPDCDKRQLLSRNLDILANIYLAQCFLPGGEGNLMEQLRQINIHPDEAAILKAINLDQIFVCPWSKGQHHLRAYKKMMTRLCSNCPCDETSLLLFQLVALFHNDDLSLMCKTEASRAQEHFATMLLKQLKHVSFGGSNEASVRYANLLVLLQELRSLADILTDKV